MRLLKWLSLGAVIWIVYWGVAAWGLRSGFEAWFSEQQRQGWHVAYGPMTTSGFPTRHVTHLEQPQLADPGTGVAWSADWIEFDSPALWPGAQSLRFAPTPQRFSLFDQTRSLVAENMRAELQLAPGLALELEQLSLTSQAWQISDSSGALWQAQGLSLKMRQLAQPEHYQLSANAQGVSPSGLLRVGFGGLNLLKDDLSPQFSTLQIAAELTFDTPWDRRAIELRRPQPRKISLDLAEAQWGDMLFRSAGELVVDDLGRISGELTLRVENWRGILDLAERLSLLPPSTRTGAEKILALFSTGTGAEEKIDTTLRFQQGQIWAGPLPIGTAPRLVLR